MRNRWPKLMILCVALAVSLGVGCDGAGGPADAEAASHPRLMLDRATLTDLRSRARHHSRAWKALRSVCDSYRRGRVERPDGEGYPDGGGIGAGYQGDGYYPSVIALGLCYQTANRVDRRRAKRYGRIGAELISKMASEGSHAADPTTDSVYGIRNYGIGLAIGYDWLYRALKPSVRARVRRVENRWITTYQREGFGRNFPQGNYFAGYYAATGLAAMAMGGDRGAPISWKTWLSKVQRPVAKYYEDNLPGGGWPEGWNYGPLGTVNQELPLLAARTAKHVNLTRGYRFPLGTGRFLIHFTWPDRTTLDDSGTVHEADNPTAAERWLYTFQAAVLAKAGDPFAGYLRSFARAVSQKDSPLGPPWTASINFLFDRGGPTQDFTTLPLSYLATGIDMAAMRSSWETSAVWGSFTGGPYVNNPDNGEEYFDKGSLSIVNGSRPFLVNATAALQRNTPGTEDGGDFSDPIYEDLFGDGGKRSIFNVFYVDRPTPLGQNAKLRSQGARTRISAFDDAGGSLFARSTDLQDVYPRAGDATISGWTRELVYLRPGTFVVHDRTAVTDPALGQWMAFHLSGRPQPVAAAAGVASYDVQARSGYAGRVHVVLPQSHDQRIVDVMNGHKVFRLEVRGAAAGAQEWLTVFDAAPGADAASSAQALTPVAGPMSGVLLRRAGGNEAVLLSQRAESQPVTEEVVYRVPAADARHVIAGLSPGAQYAVTATAVGGELEVHCAPGGGLTASSAGVLRFRTDAAGKVTGE
jgi:hypothetical protein